MTRLLRLGFCLGAFTATFCSVALYAHPESASGSCHYHLDSEQEHCAANVQKAPVEEPPAVVQELIPADEAAPPGTAYGDDNAAAIVENFQRLEALATLVTSIQGGLRRLGYDPGPPTGAMNGQTEIAIKAFQKDNLLPESGTPTLSLLTIIEDELEIRTRRRTP